MKCKLTKDKAHPLSTFDECTRDELKDVLAQLLDNEELVRFGRSLGERAFTSVGWWIDEGDLTINNGYAINRFNREYKYLLEDIKEIKYRLRNWVESPEPEVLTTDEMPPVEGQGVGK